MIVASAVVVLLNGVVVPTALPAELVAGRVMVPATAITRFADRVAVDPLGTITIEGRGHRCTLRIGIAEATCDDRTRPLELSPFFREGTAFVPLADVARALGGEVVYDVPSGTAAVQLPPDRRVETPAPFDPRAPQATPTTVFTPQPPSPTPRPAESGSPRPRRTAVPVIVP
jgi:hypothetical protein